MTLIGDRHKLSKLSLDNLRILIIVNYRRSLNIRTMARRPRLLGKKTYHHIYAWGNDRHPVFKDESHYEKYLVYLEHYSHVHGIDIVTYALMTWHIHLFVYDKLGNLSQLMNSVHGEYAQYFNRATERVGHVFGERFNNRIVQVNNYGLWLSRYIHRQPLEAGYVKELKDYRWSSYRGYIGVVPMGFVKPGIILKQFGQGKLAYCNYEEFVLNAEVDPTDWDKIPAAIIGDEDFRERFEELRTLKNDEKGEALRTNDLIEIISKRLKIEPALLLNPYGLQERRLRHRAFAILVREYRLSVTRVSQLFGTSAMAVTKALKTKS